MQNDLTIDERYAKVEEQIRKEAGITIDLSKLVPNQRTRTFVTALIREQNRLWQKNNDQPQETMTSKAEWCQSECLLNAKQRNQNDDPNRAFIQAVVAAMNEVNKHL